MPDEKSAVRLSLALLLLVILGFSLFINLPVMFNNFLSADQSTYFAMAQSIARDGDLEYTKKDLVRYYQSFESGPQGIFLKKGADGKIFYAKSFAYSLFAAPFVRIFGANGFYVFHSLLFLLALGAGVSYLSLTLRPFPSLAAVLTFFFASAAVAYFVWITPDFFNLCLVFIILYLWIYKIRRDEAVPTIEPKKPGRFEGFLLSGGSDYLAAFLAGIASFSKPPNAVLAGPIFLTALIQKKYKKSLGIVLAFLASAIIFFGTNFVLTSEWNFMGGQRKTFYFEFPLEKDAVTFDSVGSSMTSEGYFGRSLLPPKFLIYNVFYYVFGRFSGIAWYFFPAIVFLIAFLAGRKAFPQRLLFAALVAEIFAYLIFMPKNFGGGGGSLANRYFLNIFPLFFFLPSFRPGRKHLALMWAWAALFTAPILFTPFQSSASPAAHAKRFPYKWLPLEMTLVNEWPTNTNPSAFMVPIGTPPNDGYLYFLNDNYNKKTEPTGLWTWDNRTLEIVLKTYYPLQTIIIHLVNNPRQDNLITVSVDGMKKKIILQPKSKGILEFPVGKGFNFESIYLHRIKVGASKGAIPYYESEASLERRHLGVFFELELVPAR